MAKDKQPVASGAQVTLRNSPTGGVSGEHTPYYRRLLSAGYKGYLQGVIGGSTLYGLMGAAIGAMIAAPIALGLLGAAPIALAWMLVPTLAGIGLFKGASTFGQIGSYAAISAESAEMIEDRRYLLERYYSLPLSKEYDDEAREIERILNKQHEAKPPKHVFHWKTMLICATLGVGIAVLTGLYAPGLLVALKIPEVLVEAGILAEGAKLAALSGPALGVAAAIGGLAGAFIGLDRYYVRRWLDVSENILVDRESVNESIREKSRDVERLINASPTRGAETSSRRGTIAPPPQPAPVVTRSPEPSPPLVNTDQPQTTVSSVEREARLADIAAAIGRPVV